MNHLIAIAGASLLVGGAIGYLAGNQAGSDDGPLSEAQAREGTRTVLSDRRIRDRQSSSGSGAISDRPRSLEEVVNTPGQTARLQALVDLYSGLTREEFPAEADKLEDLPFTERILNAYVLFAAWAELAPYDAFEHANTKMGRTGSFVRPTILQSWAASDPRAAADYYQANKSDFAMMGMRGRGRGASGVGTIAGEWAKQDPEGALAWAKSLEGSEQADASVKVLSQIASADPARAAELATGLKGRALADVNRTIASEWAKSDWNRAENFIDTLPTDQKGEALGAAVEALAGDDPSLAASKALEIPEGEARNEAIETVAETMAREQPAAAAEWVASHGTEETQREAMRDIVSNWVSQDPNSAKDWVLSRPDGPVRDAAVSSFVMSDSKGPPAQNVKLAESITDERSRGWAVGMATMRWMGEDREAAINYLQTSEVIDDRMRQRILRRSGEGQDSADGSGR